MTANPTPSQTYHLILLRHGESVGNANGVYQGQADFELSDLGRRQAQALAERWVAEEKTFDLVISSPLLRARQTAEIIAEA
ncbi:MAG: histidine phosphatase family protein, partial [Chloroflexota bacterium]